MIRCCCFPGAEPTDKELGIYNRVNVVLQRFQMVLQEIDDYKGCQDLARKVCISPCLPSLWLSLALSLSFSFSLPLFLSFPLSLSLSLSLSSLVSHDWSGLLIALALAWWCLFSFEGHGQRIEGERGGGVRRSSLLRQLYQNVL